MRLPAGPAGVAPRSSCSCTSPHWANPLPVTLIVMPGVAETGDSASVTTDTFVEARLIPGWAEHWAVTRYGPAEVAVGTVIPCWKFAPLAVASRVPLADRPTVVLPAGSVHWVKPLPEMVTGLPAWTSCAEGVSVTTYTGPRTSAT